MKTFKSKLLTSTIAVAMATAMVPHAAAQDEETSSDSGGDTITITGSRIARDNAAEAISPVTVLGGAEIATSGQVDITALLRESPQLQNSLPGSFSAFNGGSLGVGQLNLRGLGTERTLVLEDGRRHVAGVSGTGAVDVNNISTALLERVDIMTGGASSIYGADAVSGVVNFIMRDGASFDGLEVRVQGGISDDADAGDFYASVANGFEIDGGRGDAVFALEYTSAESIRAGDRDFAGSGVLSLVENNAAVQEAFGFDERFEFAYVPNLTLPISSNYGIISIGTADDPPSSYVNAVLSGGVPGCDYPIGAAGFPACQIVDETGTLRPYNPGDVFIGAFEAVGGDAVPTQPDSELLLPQSEKISFNAKTTYDLTSYLSWFADAKYVYTETTESNQVNGFNDDIPIALDNPYIPAALQAQIETLQAEGEEPLIVISRDTLDNEVLPRPVAERHTFRVVTGFEGQIPLAGGLDYELSYNYGRTDADITNQNTRIEDRFFAAIDAVRDPETGEIVCRSSIDPDAPLPGPPFPTIDENYATFTPGDGSCAPINIFGRDTITGAGADFAFIPTTSTNEIEQQVFLATLSGDSEFLFSLPGGPLAYAVGYESRKEESQFSSDGLVQAGLTFSSNYNGPTLPSGGEFETDEVFIEVEAPLLADLPFIDRLELNGAYRKSDYSTIGEADAWSYGGRYSPFPSLTFRTTVSQAVRAPNINELFAPLQPDSIGALEDPCDEAQIDNGTEFRRANCEQFVNVPFEADANYTDADGNVFPGNSAFVPGQSGGNPDLEAETADTFTFGAVWDPTEGALAPLQVIIDYYEIEIEGLIDTLDSFQIAQNCVDLPSIDNQFCDQIFRDPKSEGGFINGFVSGEVNLGAVEVSGVDFTISYDREVPQFFGEFDHGDIDLTLLGTNFLKDEETPDPTAPDEKIDILGTTATPEWIVNFDADWSKGNLTLGYGVRYESSQLSPGITNIQAENKFYATILETGDSFVHDVSFDYLLSDKFSLYGGVNNLFEEEPYAGSYSRPAGPVGRFFYLGVDAQF